MTTHACERPVAAGQSPPATTSTDKFENMRTIH